MWTRGEREKVEQKYGIRGSTYQNTVIGILQRNPHALPLVRDLVREEKERLDKTGLDQEIDTVMACLVKAPFDITKESLMALEDDEYASVVDAVRSVIFRYDEKLSHFETELPLIIKDEKVRKRVGKLAREVFTGQYLKKD